MPCFIYSLNSLREIYRYTTNNNKKHKHSGNGIFTSRHAVQLLTGDIKNQILEQDLINSAIHHLLPYNLFHKNS